MSSIPIDEEKKKVIIITKSNIFDHLQAVFSQANNYVIMIFIIFPVMTM